MSETFTTRLRVHWDDNDLLGMVHNARWPLFMERALTDFFVHLRDQGRVQRVPGTTTLVARIELDHLAPFFGVGELAVDVAVHRLGRTSTTFALELRSPDGATLYARGRRTLVNVSRETLRPVPWSEAWREVCRDYLADADAGESSRR